MAHQDEHPRQTSLRSPCCLLLSVDMCQITMTLRFKSVFPLILSAVKSLAMITGFLVSFGALIICLTHFEVQLSEYNLFLKNTLILMHLFRSIKLPYYMIFSVSDYISVLCFNFACFRWHGWLSCSTPLSACYVFVTYIPFYFVCCFEIKSQAIQVKVTKHLKVTFKSEFAWLNFPKCWDYRCMPRNLKICVLFSHLFLLTLFTFLRAFQVLGVMFQFSHLPLTFLFFKWFCRNCIFSEPGSYYGSKLVFIS